MCANCVNKTGCSHVLVQNVNIQWLIEWMVMVLFSVKLVTTSTQKHPISEGKYPIFENESNTYLKSNFLWNQHLDICIFPSIFSPSID